MEQYIKVKTIVDIGIIIIIMSSLVCSVCKLTFNSRYQQKEHYREAHQSYISVSFNDEMVKVKKTDEGWVCPFSACEYINRTGSPRAFHAHCNHCPHKPKGLKPPTTANDGDVIPITNITTQKRKADIFLEMIRDATTSVAVQLREKEDREYSQLSQILEVRKTMEELGIMRGLATDSVNRPDEGCSIYVCAFFNILQIGVVEYLKKSQKNIAEVNILFRHMVVTIGDSAAQASTRKKLNLIDVEKTCPDYANIGARFLMFLIRVIGERFDGFSELRDNIAFSRAMLKLRTHHFAELQQCLSLVFKHVNDVLGSFNISEDSSTNNSNNNNNSSSSSNNNHGVLKKINMSSITSQNAEFFIYFTPLMEKIFEIAFTCPTTLFSRHSSMISLFIILCSTSRIGLSVVGTNATRHIAALQYHIHCVIVSKAKAQNAQQISSGEKEDVTILKLFNTDDQQTSYMELVSLFGLFKHCKSQGLTLPKLVFLGDDPTRFDRIAVNGKELSIANVSAVVHHLRKMAADVLFTRILGLAESSSLRKQMEAVDFSSITENFNDKSNDYSFVSELETRIPTLKNYKAAVVRFLGNALINKEGIMVAEQSQGCVDNARTFIEYISVLKDVATGQPGRKSESNHLTIVQEHDKDRNIFIHAGHIAIVPLYNKQDKRTGRHMKIYRFFDIVTSKLMIYYLYLVVPILLSICHHTAKADINLENSKLVIKTVLFQTNGQRFDDRFFHSAFIKHFNEALTQTAGRRTASFFVSELRQWIVAIAVKNRIHFEYINSYYNEMVNNDDDADKPVGFEDGNESTYDWLEAEADQAGHRVTTHLTNYGISNNRDPSHATFLAFQSQLNSSRSWHRLLNIVKQVVEEQSPPIPKEQSPPPSRDHRDLRLTKEVDTRKSEAALMLNQPSLENGNEAFYLINLRRLMKNEKAQFSSIEQATAIKAIMSGKNCLIVLPTGGGKTIAYTLPAFIENRRWESQLTPTTSITVVILPLVILKADQYRRLKECSLKVKIWQLDTLRLDENALRLTIEDDMADLVLVGLEVAVSDIFNCWLRHKAATNKLRRIVIDEAHLLLDQGDFRTNMVKIASIRCTNFLQCIPTIAVTATAPPNRVNQLFARIGAEPQQFITVRGCTDRLNLIYNIVPAGSDAQRTLLAHISSFRDDQYNKDKKARMMVFFTTIAAITDVSKMLKDELIESVVFVGRGLTREQKEQAWDSFISEAGPFVLLGTLAAGIGADYGNIRKVIIYGACADIGLFIQLAGRAGRDGNPAEVAFIYSPATLATYARDFQCENDYDFANLSNLVTSQDRCIRQMLVRFNDGVEYASCPCIPGAQFCSCCTAMLNNNEPSTIDTEREQVNLTNDAWARTDALLNDVAHQLAILVLQPNVSADNICVHCFLRCNPKGFLHARMPPSSNDCTANRHTCFKCLQSGHGARNCPNKLNFQPLITCYYCALPMDNTRGHIFHEETLVPTEAYLCTSGGKDFVVPVCLALYTIPNQLKSSALLKYFGSENVTMDTYRTWLSTISEGTNSISNCLHMFLYICKLRAELMAACSLDLGDEYNEETENVKRRKRGDDGTI